MYPGRPFDEVWESQKEQLKAKKIRLRWKTAIEKVKPQIPKRLTSIEESWKYNISHSSYHGLRYWFDKKLHPVERIFWVLAFLISFGWAAKIIYQIYTEFQLKKSNIIIDEVNKEIEDVPFPSVTVCPPTRVDWVKALAVADKLLTSQGNEKAKQYFLDLLDSAADIRLSNLDELRLNTNDTTVLQILNEINVTEVMLSVLPECEAFIFNCSWRFTKQSCCDIFELQRSSCGFCYSFNSLTSEKSEGKTAQIAYSYGMHSGLRFSTVLTNKSRLPPSMKDLDYHSMSVMFSDVRTMPLKSRYFAFGSRYYVSIKFTCSNASPDVLALENERHPPCKHDNGYYKYENCIMQCMLTHVKSNCSCVPNFFFKPPCRPEFRPCNVSDMRCIAAAINGFQLRKDICQCVNECEFIDYDDFIGTIPSFYQDRIRVDVHFNGPSGVCYKREIVLNTLDMLVQFGGIFGLFVGGSFISFAELFYAILLTLIITLYCKFNYLKKKERNKPRLVIEVHSRNDSVLRT